jgi:penicillin-insensitive murein endopeptidase
VLKLSILFGLAIVTGTVLAQEKAESVCYGTPENGSLENGWKLPFSGANFEPYSGLGPTLGRTYVHSSVYKAVVGAYAALTKSRPDNKYMYGETGNEAGGRFRPHKTHANGLSVDFMVPVRDRNGKSVPLRTSPLNKFGYSIEFSSSGEWEDLTIDFEAMADHLLALEKEAQKNGIGIRRVIFDNQLQSLLFAKSRGMKLEGITFAKFKPWVRHDEHYHVDFEVKCRK